MRRGRLLALALGLAASTPGVSRADAPAIPLARLLRSPARPHALADATGRIPVTVPLPPGVAAEALGLLPVAPGFGAVRLDPDALEAFGAAHPELRLLAGPPRRALLDVSSAWTRADVFRKATGGDGKGVVVGIVDTGIDIFHPDFRNKDGTTRIAWLLAAGTPLGLYPDLEKQFGCSVAGQTPCAILARKDLDAILHQNAAPPLRDIEGHGTHVASIAAGNGGPMANPTPRYVGVAPGATLVIAAPSPPGAGFYDPDLLNAASFVFDRAAALGMPVVVNLSIGGDFGPHDGTSALEKGLTAMVGDDRPGRAVVVAAGNSGALFLIRGDGPYGSHTEAHLSPYADTRIPILAPASTTGQGYVWVTFRPGDKVSVALEGPGGHTWVGLTDPGQQNGYKGSDGATAGVVNDLATAGTSIPADTNGAVVAWDGGWADQSEFAIHLRGTGDAELWVVGEGDVSPSKSDGLLFVRALRQGTINVPASAPALLAVGCTLNRVDWSPISGSPISLTSLGGQDGPLADSACYFSAAGPTPSGLPKPEISAPGGFVAAAMSADADPRRHPGGLFDEPGCPTSFPCFVVDERHAIAAGTSMSAPHVAGAVALLFQQDPTLTQARVTEVLQAGARHPAGRVPYDYQLGPGELDLEGARQALAMEQATPHEPDAARSWYVLSSAYARADPTWPVWGTVELRRADGSIASGLDGSRLGLVVTGGVVVQRLVKVRDGLFRFAVAGPAGGTSAAMTVDVSYAGASLGTRTLRVGTDAWTARGGVGAEGGCGFSPARPGGGGAAALVALALLARRRRRYFDR